MKVELLTCALGAQISEVRLAEASTNDDMAGEINDLAIDVYCDEAGLHWRQEEPNTLRIGYRDKPTEIWHAGANRPYLAADVLAIQRTPGGHPEGYLEAFANIYRAFGEQLRGAPCGAWLSCAPAWNPAAGARSGSTFERHMT